MRIYLLELPFLLISVISIIITVYDKQRAKSKKRRIPERVLLLFSAFGGSVAMFAVMLLIRHKTKHIKFMLGLPLIFMLQCGLIYLLFSNGLLKI